MEEIRKTTIILLIFIVFLFIIIGTVFHPLAFVYSIEKSYYKGYAKWESKHSELVDETARYCSGFMPSKYAIECVVTKVGKKYKYNASREGLDNIGTKKSDEIYSGYVCRDIAITYDAIFKKLGFHTDFVIRFDHVYNQVWYDSDTKYMECVINMDDWYCW